MRVDNGAAHAPGHDGARKRKVRSVPWAKRPADDVELSLEDIGAILLAFAVGAIALIAMVRLIAF